MSKNPDRLITLHFEDVHAYLTGHKHVSVVEALNAVDTDDKYPVCALTPQQAKKLGQALIDMAKGKLDTEDAVATAEWPIVDDE
jgi:hypothetical protein